MNNVALITGIEGFTGRYVSQELANNGWLVYGTASKNDSKNDRIFQANLLDEKNLKLIVDGVQPDAVIHLAAVSFVGHGSPGEFYETNIIGTRNLLESLGRCKKAPKTVVLSSSANVYGNTSEGVLTESMIVNPENDYAVSKLAMEHMARLWSDYLPIVITRPFNYTGVCQSPRFIIPKIVDHFKNRARTLELGNLDVWRDFSDVRVVAEIYRRLLETSPSGETINICSGRAYSLREILAIVEKLSGHSLEVSVNPNFVRANEVKKLVGDVAKLKNLTGNYRMINLEETLDWMLRTECESHPFH